MSSCSPPTGEQTVNKNHPLERYFTVVRPLTVSRFEASADDVDTRRQSFTVFTVTPRATVTTARMTWLAPGARLFSAWVPPVTASGWCWR